MAVLIRLFCKPMSDRTYRHQALEGELMARAEQTLTALPVVQFGQDRMSVPIANNVRI